MVDLAFKIPLHARLLQRHTCACAGLVGAELDARWVAGKVLTSTCTHTLDSLLIPGTDPVLVILDICHHRAAATGLLSAIPWPLGPFYSPLTRDPALLSPRVGITRISIA